MTAPTAKPFTGDVAITGDKIVYVGPKATMTAKRTIDANGMIVSPGLIDAHTHADRFVDSPDKGQRANAAWTMQGVSTVFVGVDGNGTPDLKANFAKLQRPGHRHQCRVLCRVRRHPQDGDRRCGARAHARQNWTRNRR